MVCYEPDLVALWVAPAGIVVVVVAAAPAAGLDEIVVVVVVVVVVDGIVVVVVVVVAADEIVVEAVFAEIVAVCNNSLLVLFPVFGCTRDFSRDPRGEGRDLCAFHAVVFCRGSFYFYNTGCWPGLDNRMDWQTGKDNSKYMRCIRLEAPHG